LGRASLAHGLQQLPAENLGHLLGSDAVPMVVNVDLRRPLNRRARLWERLGGPHHARGHGYGAGRGWPPVAPSPCEQGHQAGDPNADNYHGDSDQNMDDRTYGRHGWPGELDR
jgi:hypothetical protein